MVAVPECDLVSCPVCEPKRVAAARDVSAPVVDHYLCREHHVRYAINNVCPVCARARELLAASAPTPAGRKDDAGKAPWHLVPWRELADVVAVIAHGAKTYGEWNWQGVEAARDRYFAALTRHLVAWRMGESKDPDSGLPHIAHVACNALFLAWHDRKEAL